MQIGMIGLGKMGGNMAQRLRNAGHAVVGYDRGDNTPRDVDTLEGLVAALEPPRAVWVMVPSGAPTTATIVALRDLLEPGDLVIDGGNSRYTDDAEHADLLGAEGIEFLDAGVSGGVWGLQNGYALMVGGKSGNVARVQPIFDALKPVGEFGFVHAGQRPGAGHFAKMVHNGIEYGLMAAYAEGLNILAHADAGARPPAADAETAPLARPEDYRYSFDLARLTEVWRHGSVVSSWLLDLTAQALAGDPALGAYAGRVSDSGEGRWTLQAAIDTGTPAPVLASALFQRFDSRGETEFANRVLSAMRHAFGGHLEKH